MRTGRVNKELRVVALNGFLGYGFDVASLDEGMEARPHLLGADAGSTDPGPYYLGSGRQLVKEAQVRRDLRLGLLRARRAGVPLIIGSAGTAGGEPHLQVTLELLIRLAREEDLHFRTALIHSEIPRALLKRALGEGRIRPLPGVGELEEATVESAARIVGQMGTEPFIRALEGGAEVVLAGRACDTAVFASLPLMEGYDPGLAFHMAKIMECGCLCATPAAAADCVMGILRSDHFLIRTLNPGRRVSPASVAGHSLYEQPDPFRFEEPEGMVDLSGASFEQVDARTVRVSGSRLLARSSGTTIKLEGASLRGFRSVSFAGARDPAILAHLEEIESTVRSTVERNLESKEEGYDLSFHYYGRDGVLGDREPLKDNVLHEVGVLIEAVAATQERADTVLALARSSFLHCSFPGRKTTAGNLAFPLSPSDISCGLVYEFTIYHILEGERETELFPVEFLDV